MKENCTKCRYFESYCDYFFQDKYEPMWCGYCRNEENNINYADEDNICKYYEIN